jgi:hypothetical protein
MERLKELSQIEMQEISGGVNPAYEIGYAFGKFLRDLMTFTGLNRLSKSIK